VFFDSLREFRYDIDIYTKTHIIDTIQKIKHWKLYKTNNMCTEKQFTQSLHWFDTSSAPDRRWRPALCEATPAVEAHRINWPSGERPEARIGSTTPDAPPTPTSVNTPYRHMKLKYNGSVLTEGEAFFSTAFINSVKGAITGTASEQGRVLHALWLATETSASRPPLGLRDRSRSEPSLSAKPDVNEPVLWGLERLSRWPAADPTFKLTGQNERHPD